MQCQETLTTRKNKGKQCKYTASIRGMCVFHYINAQKRNDLNKHEESKMKRRHKTIYLPAKRKH